MSEAKIVPVFLILMLVIAAIFGVVGMVGISINETHVAERGHTKASTLLPAYREGVCAGKWVGYNIAAGTILVACGIKDTTKCLFVVYRVTENMGMVVLSADDAYNTTCYVDDCKKAKSRDGYLDWEDDGTWLTAPLDLKAALISAFGEP